MAAVILDYGVTWPSAVMTIIDFVKCQFPMMQNIYLCAIVSMQ